MNPPEPIKNYVIYNKPIDYPNEFVGRIHSIMGDDTIKPDKELFARGKTLAEVRAKIPRGLFCFQRHYSDDECVVETWM